MTLAERSPRLELMDTEEVPYPEFQDCLRQLERINRASLGYRPTLAWLGGLARAGRWGDRPLTVLDVGFGHGDMLRRVGHWAARRGLPVRLEGVDLSPWSARAAGEATPPDLPIRYHVGDVFDWDRPADLILSALFTHHLPDPELVRFLRWMEGRARVGWFINDLHRHAVPYGVVAAAARLLPVNRLVRHDAPLSVARSFTRADWLRLGTQAGLPPGAMQVHWHFPFRWGVGRVR